jgi:ABC-2 type transport system ATP-binding protein
MLDGVTASFSRRGHEPVVAVRDLSFEISRGLIFCLLGPNGSGKTTTVNMICGLLAPKRGDIRVYGHSPSRERREVLRRLSVVPQETALYDSLTGRENLGFHAHYYGVPKGEVADRIARALDVVQLTDRQHDRVGTYSGGMQRRLALGRALLTAPDLLLLDEPTLGVDVQSRRAIWDRVRELADAGTSVLLTTNYMEEAEELADDIMIIDRGARVARGSLDELRAMVARQRLILHFPGSEAAQRAQATLAAQQQVNVRDSTLEVELDDPREALRLVGVINDRLSGLSEGPQRFEFKESNLQDVFLRFTGRELRD